MKPTDVAASNEDRGRFSARRKTKAILRLLRGEDIDVVSRELGVTAATVAGWRDHFLAGGQAALKTRQPDARDEDVMRPLRGQSMPRISKLSCPRHQEPSWGALSVTV